MAAREERELRQNSFQIYVTDALKVISESTAKFAGGSYMQKRFADIMNPKKPQAEETRTGKEIADDIIGRLTKGGS